MLLFCDFKGSDGLGICTLRVSVAPSGCEAVRVCLLLQQSWEGRIATGKGVYHIAAGRHFSFSGYLPSAAGAWAASVRFSTAVWVYVHTGVSSQSVRMQEWGALSHLKSFFRNRKGGEKKILFLSDCLELLLVGARLQLQMCWTQCQLSWQMQYLCCCPQYLFQTAWAIKCSGCKTESGSRACRCWQSLRFVFLTYIRTDCCNEGTKWF